MGKAIGIFCALLSLVTFVPAAAAQTASIGVNQEDTLVRGYDAFRSGDWTSATFFLRKAMVSPSSSSPEALYMLIMSQIYSGSYGTVITDCDAFFASYSDSPMAPMVKYQKGRVQHLLGLDDDAVLTLSDFCHENSDSVLYPSALFWIAECFFDDYNFEAAKTIYERIVSDYPSDSKYEEAVARLDVIAQREREQKLLYLLKMTGEEYLSSRENYEKQLKQYQSEDVLELRRQLMAANSRISELEQAAADALTAAQTAQQPAAPTTSTGVTEDDLAALKAKAERLKKLLEAQQNRSSEQ